MPPSFTCDERVAAKNDGDVMVPSGERAPLEVVEVERALQLLVSAEPARIIFRCRHR